MRRLMLAAAMLGTVSAAQAADMPDLPILRGGFTDGLSKTTRNWDGVYAGGSFGYSSASTDFSQSVVGLTNFIFRDSVLQGPTSSWSLLNKTTTQGANFGGFVGPQLAMVRCRSRPRGHLHLFQQDFLAVVRLQFARYRQPAW
ncbi:opacity protein-like surface antigen [Bradyrhizobium sp. i1.7.7]